MAEGDFPLRSDANYFGAGATFADFSSGCVVGCSAGEASLDLSADPSLPGAFCAEENFLKDI